MQNVTVSDEELRMSEQRYRSLVRATAQIVWETAADGTVGDLPEWRAVTGQTREEVAGWGWLDAVHPEDRTAVEAAWRHAIATGNPYQTEYRIRFADGSYRPHIVRGVPILHENDEIREWVGACTDITALRRNEAERQSALARLGLLVRAGDELNPQLTVDGCLSALTELVVPTLADGVAVHLSGLHGIELATVAHVDPGRTAALRRLVEALPMSVDQPVGPGAALANGQPRYAERVSHEQLAAVAGDDPQLLAGLGHLGMASVFVVPLVSRGRTLGAMTLGTGPARRLDESDRAVAMALGRRAALALDNAQLFQSEREQALGLQQLLLPKIPQTVEGLEVYGHYRAGTVGAAVGGDWYDVLPLPDGTTAVTVGDVMGHDLTAAAAMGQLRGVLRTCAWDLREPALVLDRLDELVRTFDIADLATTLYARIRPTPDGAEFSHASAGHLPPLVIFPDGHARLLPAARSVLVGVAPIGPRPQHQESLQRGSVVVLFTDGLVEARGADLDERLALLENLAAAYGAGCDLADLCVALVQGMGAEESNDDVALLAVRITE